MQAKYGNDLMLLINSLKDLLNFDPFLSIIAFFIDQHSSNYKNYYN
jgi:hypothetical protein